MGYYGKLEEKEKVIKLRQDGHSYNEIKKQVSVSKDTISRWCREIKLTKKQLLHLQKLQKNGLRSGSQKGADANKQKRINNEKILLKIGKKEIGKLTKREKFLIGVALYIGEGTKNGSTVDFTNSNPKIIQFMVNWLIRFCNIPKLKIKANLWLHDNNNEQNAKKYWSQITGLPLENFGSTYIAKNKANSKKIRKNIYPFGIIKIRHSNVQILRKIHGWMEGILVNS
jgi:transposase